MACFKWQRLLPKIKGPKDKKPDDPKSDAYMGSKFVYSLDQDNFKPFLKGKDIALVMFYQPDCKKCAFSRDHFKKASENTKRDNHAFAAVNCKQVPGLCCSQDIPEIPYFKMFSRGRFIGFNDDYKLFIHKDMKKWVERMHVFTHFGVRINPTNKK